MSKKRLDQLLRERYPEFSRTHIQSWVTQGKVTVNGTIITKVGVQVHDDSHILLDIQGSQYVSRAGLKLEKALEYFSLDVRDKIILDAGLSTGGFTDCLLQHGAKKVYGIDVGYGQVHEKIKNDERVVVMERTNLRNVKKEALAELVDMVTLDLSFISVLKVMDVVGSLLKIDGELLVLIKPQFEARKEQVGRGGLITDLVIHQDVVKRVVMGIQKYGFNALGVVDSPIEGASGNREFIAYFQRLQL